jgi:hypothetical protein
MLDLMTEPTERAGDKRSRTRLIIDTEDVIRRAIRLRAVKIGGDVTISDLVNEALREAFADEIAEVEAYPHGTTGTGKKPGRKSKKEGGAE